MTEYDQRAADRAAPQAEHLVAFPGSRWGAWRWVGLRSAGFPIEQTLRLANPACAAAADTLLAAERALEQAREQAVLAIHAGLGQATPDERNAIVRAIRKIRKGQTVPGDTAELATLRVAHADAELAAAAWQRSYTEAGAQTSAVLAQVASDAAFREALVWQNRHALKTGVEPLLRHPAGAPRTAKHRLHEAMVANYIQRYCTKNDTIGFFGPVGWAQLAVEGPPIAVRPGPRLLAVRNVYFDGWCIETLAARLAEDVSLRPWLAPRRMPHIDVSGATLHLPMSPPIELPPAQAAVLRACDGLRSARQLAADLLATPGSGVTNEAQVYAILDALQRARRIVWALEVPLENLRPEVVLRQKIARVGDPRRRTGALAALDRLTAARDAVAAAAGDSDQLNQAMERLEATFTELTDSPATRRAGQTYAGRTLLYEDCRRDVAVTLGPALLETLGPPLELVLASARWYSHRVAQWYRAQFTAIYAELASRDGPAVEFTSFWYRAHALLFDKHTFPTQIITRDLQERWAGVLDLPPGQRRVDLRSDDLRAAVARAFDAPGIGWPMALYNSPDLMLAADGVAAIARGDYLWVMGETHPAANTLRAALFIHQHPDPQELLAANERDFPTPQVLLMASREGEGGLTLRLSLGLTAPKAWRLVFARDSCDVSPEQALPVGALVMERRGADLLVRTRDGRLSFEIIELLGDILTFNGIHEFDMFADAAHTPRVCIDRLVVSRETWRFACAELAGTLADQESERFLAVRRWAAAHGLPRFVFVKTPIETKPFYLDLDSLASVDLFMRAVRRTQSNRPDAAITVSEMLPSPQQLWLTDAEGRRYTSELRTVTLVPPELR